jgi:hypothetical protein
MLPANKAVETNMATSIPNTGKAISLKLLVDKSSNKVLFAEAGKDFVDFLFGLIHIPIGSIMGLLWSHGIPGPGSLSSVFESIQNLDPTCLHQTKEELLMPEPAFPSNTHPPPLLLNFVPPKQQTGVDDENQFFSSKTRFGSHAVDLESLIHSSPLKGSAVKDKETGYVKGVATFTVMDNLMVKPMSTITSITLLNTFNVKDVSLLQEKTVNVDLQKVLFNSYIASSFFFS